MSPVPQVFGRGFYASGKRCYTNGSINNIVFANFAVPLQGGFTIFIRFNSTQSPITRNLYDPANDFSLLQALGSDPK